MARVPSLAVFVRFQFEGFHRWVDAPEQHSYLRDMHRHMFHVEVSIDVTDSDRQVEFILLKRELTRIMVDKFGGNSPAKGHYCSCEQMALFLLDVCINTGYTPSYISVSEDGENGATVWPHIGDDGKAVRVPSNMAGYCDICDAKPCECSIGDERPEKEDEPDDARPDPCAELGKRFGDNPFIGYEAEGPMRGWPTLFIPFSCKSEEQIEEAWKAYLKLNPLHTHVYLGAGNSLWEGNLPCIEDWNVEYLTIEAGSFRSVNYNQTEPVTTWVLRDVSGEYPSNFDLYDRLFWKRLTESGICWESCNTPAKQGFRSAKSKTPPRWFTRYDDPLFKLDRLAIE